MNIIGKDDRVLCVRRENIPAQWLQSCFFKKYDAAHLNQLFRKLMIWVSRPQAEHDTSLKQFIPYLLIRLPNGQFACYQRKGNEKRLHGLWSAGVGGHIDYIDAQFSENLMDIAMAGAKRELTEEFRNPHVENISFQGIINEEVSKVGKVHTGLVYVIKLKEAAIPEAELFNLEWTTAEKILKRKTELWTQLALSLTLKLDTPCF